jgi:hypothetical protein
MKLCLLACDENGLAVFERLRRKPSGKHVFLYAFDLLDAVLSWFPGCRIFIGNDRRGCVSYFTLRWLSKKCNVAKNPMELAIIGVRAKFCRQSLLFPDRRVAPRQA